MGFKSNSEHSAKRTIRVNKANLMTTVCSSFSPYNKRTLGVTVDWVRFLLCQQDLLQLRPLSTVGVQRLPFR